MSATQPVDSSILHEIVRIIESRRKVPEKVIVKSREYLLTYLEDHQRRLEEALTRYDADRLNMLYGQLASKIKYQLLRRIPARAAAAMGMTPAPVEKKAAPAKPAAPKAAKPAAAAKSKPKPAPAPKAAAKKVAAKKAVAKKPAAKKAAARTAAKKPAAKKPAAKKPGAKKAAPQARAAARKPSKAKKPAARRR